MPYATPKATVQERFLYNCIIQILHQILHQKFSCKSISLNALPEGISDQSPLWKKSAKDTSNKWHVYCFSNPCEYASAPDACSAATVGLTTYATSFKAMFNMGPQKTAVMPCFDAEDIPLSHFQRSKYQLLGFLLAKDFSVVTKVRWVGPRINSCWLLAALHRSCSDWKNWPRDFVWLWSVLAAGAYKQIHAM